MDLLQAIDIRVSRRDYLPEPIAPEYAQQLHNSIAQYNALTGYHFQLIEGDTGAFGSILRTYGMFRGVCNYIALVGPKQDEHFKEKCGYYGEKIVLEATGYGLGTCWVGASYNKNACTCEVLSGEVFNAVIAIGHTDHSVSRREKRVASSSHSLKNDQKKLFIERDVAPDWFYAGMAAVDKAPSAMNKKPATFYHEKNTVFAKVKSTHLFNLMDLGIAKLHFELGAGGGQWEWGNGGTFRKT